MQLCQSRSQVFVSFVLLLLLLLLSMEFFPLTLFVIVIRLLAHQTVTHNNSKKRWKLILKLHNAQLQHSEFEWSEEMKEIY